MGKTNVRLERSEFRKLKQSPTEGFNKFLVRLRTQAKRCRYDKEEEEEIIHQITSGAISAKVRDKGVDADLKLDNLVQYAIRQELLDQQKGENKRKAESYRRKRSIALSVASQARSREWDRVADADQTSTTATA